MRVKGAVRGKKREYLLESEGRGVRQSLGIGLESRGCLVPCGFSLFLHTFSVSSPT